MNWRRELDAIFLMTVTVAVFASFGSPSFGAEETTVEGKAAEEKAVKAMEESAKQFILDWVATFDKNDPQKQMAFYDRSEKLELIISAGIHLHGYQAALKAYTKDQEQVRFYDSKATKLSTRMLNETALVSFEHRFKFRTLEENIQWQVHVRTTTVLQSVNSNRVNGK